MASLKISKFQVSNFRNLNPDILEFSLGINCILGKNGNGKTNLLEALYVLGHRKSFRKNAGFPQFLSMDGDHCAIYFSSIIKDADKAHSFSYTGKLGQHSGEWALNGKSIKEKINAFLLFINPFDFYSFHSIPKFRREWFDHQIGLINKVYKQHLSRYLQALKIRNNLLYMRPSSLLGQIEAVDGELSKYSFLLLQERKRFIEEMNVYFPLLFKKLFDQEFKLEITLSAKFSTSSIREIKDYYQQNFERDSRAGKTLYGIHRDDYVLLMNGLNAFEYSSLGQQKSSFLSLLFAYIELFRYKFNSYPIVLIDDVSGELDQNRWQRLIEYLEETKFQVFITTANEGLKEKLEKIKNAKKIYINKGKITTKD